MPVPSRKTPKSILQPNLTREQSQALHTLYEACDEENPVCRQAPAIWDADTKGDAEMAKRGCNGFKMEDGEIVPPCPLINLCLTTAILLDEEYGVWGGKTFAERKKLRYRRV